MVASDSFAGFLREQLAPLGHVSLRRMFGKTGVFCDGLMFAMVTEDLLYFRVDDHNRAAFEEAGSFRPLTYEKGGRTIDLSFWRAPERLLDEPAARLWPCSLCGGSRRWRRASRRRFAHQREQVAAVFQSVLQRIEPADQERRDPEVPVVEHRLAHLLRRAD